MNVKIEIINTKKCLYRVTSNDKIQEDDNIDVIGLTNFAPNVPLKLVLNHADGSTTTVVCNHTYNEQQIEWFKAGGALNIIRREIA